MAKNIRGSKKCLVHKNFVSKEGFGPHHFGPKTVLSKIVLVRNKRKIVSKNIWVSKILNPKKSGSKKVGTIKFLVKNILGLNNVWSKTTLGQKSFRFNKFWVLKNLVPKIF